MRAFWAVIALLLLVGVVLAVRAGNAPTPHLPPPPELPKRSPAPDPRAEAPSPARAGESAAAPEVVYTDARTESPATPRQEPAPQSAAQTAAQPLSEPDPRPAPEAAQAEPPPAAPAEAGANDEAPAPSGEAKVVKRDDGSLLVDGRFVLRGNGTKESPYRPTWDHLVSAQETFDPGRGMKDLPPHVMMLDGTYVRLPGYVAFPMFVQEPRELLSMLNPWDGCCIGVPPTPYDAVEVHLLQRVSAEGRFASAGVVEGKFSVKPYLAGDWLVGLYMMEEADFKPEGGPGD